MPDQDAWGMMTIGSLPNWIRNGLRRWLGIPEPQITIDDISAVVDEQNKLKDRVQALEDAYAADPRRAEIAKEKAEQTNHLPGFTPRSKRIATWEGQRKAEPKK